MKWLELTKYKIIEKSSHGEILQWGIWRLFSDWDTIMFVMENYKMYKKKPIHIENNQHNYSGIILNYLKTDKDLQHSLDSDIFIGKLSHDVE